jgi:hypothetical protein
MECSQALSLEPGTQLEKKTSEIAQGSQHSRELEKRLNPEKVVEEDREAGQVGPNAAQESPRPRAEVIFLHEMVRWSHCSSHIEASFSQELFVHFKKY